MSKCHSIKTIKAFICRNTRCNKPAKRKWACCSQECRKLVPNCDFIGCQNAVELGILQGQDVYGSTCYKHGGRIHFDGEPQEDMKAGRHIYVKVHDHGWVIPQHSISN